MAHPNLQTNGASLEDCHTNFFALTDLCGIRWRKLTSEGYSPQTGGGGVYAGQQGHHQSGRGAGQSGQPSDYLNDPVLSSYWRCLSNDILCVWRRIPSTTSAPSPSSNTFPPQFAGPAFGQPTTPASSSSSNGLGTLSGAKELWIFWYGDTSPDLTNLVVPEILTVDGEQGSWENGLSYECRSLLFKALHNLIERCLLSRDFVRLGKWFVQPQEGMDPSGGGSQEHQQQQHNGPSVTIPARHSGGHLSFSFSFFVHGESTVCASIDVRQHPVVRKITHRHLAAASASSHNSSTGIHVMLAPYGLAGTLTGVSYRSSMDHTTRKLMDEWRQYYPVELASSSGSSSAPPPTTTTSQQQRGPGPGGGNGSNGIGSSSNNPFDPVSETEDMVEVVVGSVRMRYPACYVMVCDADSGANAAALNQLAASEGGMLMTPPASPPLPPPPSNSMVRGHSGVGAAAAANPSQRLPTVPSATAAALNRMAQAAHSWRPEEAGRLAEQAWQDSLLSPAGLSRTPEAASGSNNSIATTQPTSDNKDNNTTATNQHQLWDFVDPTTKSSCICLKSRRNGKNGAGQVNIQQPASSGGLKMTPANPSSSFSTGSSSSSSSSTSSSSATTTNTPSLSFSSSGYSGSKRGVPFHHRPSYGPPSKSLLAGGVGTKEKSGGGTNAPPPADGLQESRGPVNRPGTVNAAATGNASTPAHPAAALPTYQRSQAALRGSQSGQQQHSNSNAMNSSGGNNSVGPSYLASPASVAPSPLPTPHSHAPPSVPPMDSSLTMSSPHPPASNDPSSGFIPTTPSAADQHNHSLDHSSRATPGGGAAHTPGGPKSNAAYSPYVAIPSVDTPGWPHSAGPAAPRSSGGPPAPATSVATPNNHHTPSGGSGGSGGPDLYGIKKIVLPQKEYEEELKDEETAPGLLYDYSSMTAWLYHPVKRMKVGGSDSSHPNGDRSSDGSSDCGNSVGGGGKLNGNYGMDGTDRGESGDYDEENVGSAGSQSRKRKEPDSRDDDSNSLNSTSAGAAKPVNPSSLFTSEGLQVSYQDLDKIFDNSDESNDNDTCPVPTPPGSNKPAGMPEDTALVVMGKGQRTAPAHPSPGATTLGGHHLTGAAGGGGGGVNILAAAEFSNMFPTPPSHEHPMQSPCGQMEGSVDMAMTDLSSAVVQLNGVKSEPGMTGHNGCSPGYHDDDTSTATKDWSYVYRPPTVWKIANSAKYAPVPGIPSHGMNALLPAPYRPSTAGVGSMASSQHHPHHNQNQQQQQQSCLIGDLSGGRNPLASANPIRPFQRIPSMSSPHMGGPPHLSGRGGGGGGGGMAPFSPISPSPYGMDASHSPFASGGSAGVGPPRPGGGVNMPFTPHNTLKQLLQPHQGPMQSSAPFSQYPHHPHHPSQHHQQQQQQQQQQQHLQLQIQPHSGSTASHFGAALPECHSLMVNIVLADSMLNIFRDHNFDSCTVCVCSDGQNWVGTIRGQDAVLYLPESASNAARSNNNNSRAIGSSQQQQQQQGFGGPGFLAPPPPSSGLQQPGTGGSGLEEETCRCNCGFSALVNRHLAHQAGLFYEDELEIVGAGSTADPGQYKRGSLYAVCHSMDKEEQVTLMRSRMIECGLPAGVGGSDSSGGGGGGSGRSGGGRGGSGAGEKEVDKGDMISSTIASVVMEATAPLVDTLPVGLMELLREQCLLLHHASNPLYRAEVLQAASRKAALLHALDLSDGCDTVRNALTLALHTNNNSSAVSLTSPMHPQQQQQQPPPPPYQQHGQQQQQQQQQHWNSGGSTPNPYGGGGGGMPFNPGMGGGGVGYPSGGGGGMGGGNGPVSHPSHPMSPSLHSPTMSVRGRPTTPGAAVGGLPMAMTSPVGSGGCLPHSQRVGHGLPHHHQTMSGCQTVATAAGGSAGGAAGPVVHYWPFLHVQGPDSSQDVIRVMRTLQPLLQDSIQKKRAASLWRAPFAVQGPLTWRQFHRMAVRGTEDRCEPQPIPSVLAGFDRDWVAIGPLAIPHWDRLLLEPYSRPRDVAYIVVAPEVDYVLSRTKLFFKELSSTYEMCRFGRHVPYKGLRDGILRVGKSSAAKLANDQHPVDDWFSNIGDSPIASLLRLYAKVCRYHLAPTINSMPMDRTLLDPPASSSASAASSSSRLQAVPSPMAPPSTTPIHPAADGYGMAPPNPNSSSSSSSSSLFGGVATPLAGGVGAPTSMTDASGKPTSPKTEQSADGTDGNPNGGQPGSGGGGEAASAADDEDAEPPSIVIYIVDPFSLASDNLDVGRLTALGLLRCYHQMVSLLSETVQLNISLQLVSADAVLQLGKDLNGARRYDSLRSLALNVFSQCKKFVSQPSNVKSLTGFGPAAASDSFLKAKDEKNRAPYRVYLPAYILAPTKDRTVCDLDPGVLTTGGGPGSGPLSIAARPDKYSVLYVSYCLSEDQRWLIAACTDERGELVDSCTIGIDVPNRTKRKRVGVRRFALQRLMDFILGVISTGVHPWRLVIGRLGRMGHGELKSWSALLSRKNLLRASRHLAEICGQCSLVFPSQAPSLVSACLVSLEPDSHFRMMPDQVTPDERFGQQSANSHLSTPDDATCTHILVFPTSATTRSPQTTFHEENINGPDLGDDDLLSALNDDMGDGFEGMSGFDDIFMTWPETDQVNDGTDDLTSDMTGGSGGGLNNMGGCGTSRSPGGSMGHHGGPSSPSGRGGMRSNLNADSPSGMAGSGMAGSGRQSPRTEQEEVGTLLQQPLALGYYVSTAPTGDMPPWFWSSCPHLARACPAFLKCALHLHNHAVQQSSDDLLLQQQQQQVNNSSKVHPLDSQVTTDVLRYVMEGYNALSWLSLDPKSRDRRSCLPIHIQLLVQLYHALSALV